MRFHRSLLFGLLACLPGAAQRNTVTAPLMGYAFDASSGAIRPMRGIPGAALLGDPLDLGFPLSTAAISPRHDFALVAPAGDSLLRLVPLGEAVEMAALPASVMTSPSRIRFSPTGSAALLFQTPGRLQAIAGLPARAAVRDIDLSGLTSNPSALAISDDGSLVALSGGGAVWTVDSGANAVQLALPASTASLSFHRASYDLLAVSTEGDVYVVRNAGSDREVHLLYAADERTAAPVAAQFSDAGSWVYTVNVSGTIAAIEAATGAARMISCDCRPTSLDLLNQRGLYRLTAAGQSVLRIFDSAGNGSVWFVPPDRVRETERGEQ